jgi:hypothetical protein
MYAVCLYYYCSAVLVSSNEADCSSSFSAFKIFKAPAVGIRQLVPVVFRSFAKAKSFI